ncbi:MAG: hypothetical protein IT509_11455 [Rhodocyclaceae bacterium]|nr:hypothetical protein [Rhodocyclaceae bacterium]
MGSRFRAFAAALLAAFLTLPAFAQNYPNHAVRLVIPYAPGGPSDLLGRAVASKMGDILHVPYKGASPAMVDVVAGRVDFIMTTGLSAAKPFLDAGKVRALAVTGAKRTSVLPDVPTFAESGSPLPEMDAGVWWGLLGPAGMPQAIVAKLSDTTRQALAAQDVVARLAALNLDPMVMTPDQFAKFINSEIDNWGRVVKRVNITAD